MKPQKWASQSLGGVTIPMALIMTWMPIGVASNMTHLEIDKCFWCLPVVFVLISIWLIGALGGKIDIHAVRMRDLVTLSLILSIATGLGWFSPIGIWQVIFAVGASALCVALAGYWFGSWSLLALAVALFVLSGVAKVGFWPPRSVVPWLVLISFVALFVVWLESSRRPKRQDL